MVLTTKDRQLLIYDELKIQQNPNDQINNNSTKDYRGMRFQDWSLITR